MFPLKAPAVLAEGTRQVLKDLQAAARLPIDRREAKLAELDKQLQKLRDIVVDGHGLRLDGTILLPASGEQVWFDVSAVHTTCKTHLKGEVKFTHERRAAGLECAGQKSASLMEAHQGKLDHYALLAAMTSWMAAALLHLSFCPWWSPRTESSAPAQCSCRNGLWNVTVRACG